MQIPLKQLHQQLKKPLAALYLIATNETFLAQEARDAIYTAAKQQGFTDKNIVHFDTHTDWNTVFSSLQNFNLFSEKTVTDIRYPSIKFNTSDVDLLESYLTQPNESNLIILTTEKLSAPQQRSKWFKLIEKHAAIIQIWPVSAHELPGWIKTRFEQNGLTADVDAIKLLALLTEGHLLATHQAIEKCRMLTLNRAITTADIAHIVSDNARFTVFDLTHHILQGNASSVIRTMDGLRQTGTEPILVLWAIARELRSLIHLAERLTQGDPLQAVIRQEWPSRKPLLQSALSRLSLLDLLSLLQKTTQVDKMIKGLLPDNAWPCLTRISLAMAGEKQYA